MEFTKHNIRALAIDEKAFARGLKYYKNGAVTDVRVSTNLQGYRASVKGTHNYSVSIDHAREEEISFFCSCPSHAEGNGACKHVIATLFFLAHYQAKQAERSLKDTEQRRMVQILNYFKEQENPKIYGETFQLKLSVHFTEIVSINQGVIGLSLYAIGTRTYRVQNLRKFLADFSKKEPMKLGKEFSFIPDESRFDRESMKLMDFFQHLYQMESIFTKGSGKGVFQKSEVMVSLSVFLSLCELLGDSYFELKLNERVIEEVQYRKANPPITFDLLIEDDILSVDFDRDYRTKPLSKDGQLLLMDEILYRPEREFCIDYVPFYQYLSGRNEPMTFEGERKDQFLQYVLPRLQRSMKITIPPSIKDRYVVCDLATELYLDLVGSAITAKVVFCYGEIRLDPLTGEIPHNVILVRSQQQENDFLELLCELHFRVKEQMFVLEKDDAIFSLVNFGIEKLAALCTLYCSEDFSRVRIHSAGRLGSTIHYASGISLLDIEISYENIPQKELQDLFASLRKKKKYHRLLDGSFIDLTEEQFQKDVLWLSSLNDQKHLENETISVPVWYAPYLATVLPIRSDYEATSDDLSLMLDNLMENEVKRALPKELSATLRSYQQTGFEWLSQLSHYGFGGILADDMGLGKTLQSLAYIAANPGLHLVVCPTSLLYNWQEEVKKFIPSLSTVLVMGMPKDRKKIIEEIVVEKGKNQLIITSYPLLRRDIEYYQRFTFDSVFIDEAQFIKNPKSQNAKAVKQIIALHRFAMTGTPIENSLSELWSIFDFIMPGYLHSHHSFVDQFERPIIRGQDEDALVDLNGRTRPFILRRMKKQVLLELPDKVETQMFADMTPEQERIYLSYLDHMKNELFGQSNDEGYQNPVRLLACLTRLRQLCCHPSTFLEDYEGGSGKLSMLWELTENTLESGHRILIFSQFVSMLQMIQEGFEERGISCFYLDGTTKTEQRMDYVKRFNEGERNVFLISLKAGGTGLNLTGADTVIHYDPWWNPAVEEQASDRAYRIGQQNKVQVIRLITKNSIEEKILRLKEKKKELSDSVITSDEFFISHLSKDELLEMFEM